MLALIVRLVERSCRRAAALVTVSLLLTIALGFYVAQHATVDSDINKLINPNLPWRQQEAELDRAFPQNADLLAIVIDARNPDQAEDAAEALATALKSEAALFHTVRRPDGGRFFQRNGLLFLPLPEVQEVANQIISAQPLISTLAADPSLRGVLDALGLAAQGISRGALESAELERAFSAIADAANAALAGRHEPLSWQTLLTGRNPDPLELRRFVLTQPILDYEAIEAGEPATAAIRSAAQRLGLVPENGIVVRVTGPVALSDAQFSTLSKGAGFSTALSIGLLCAWLLAGLRSLRLSIAILVTLTVGLIATAAFAVAAVGAFNPISIAFAALFVGIAVDFGIQFGVRYRDERFRTNHLADALCRAAAGVGMPLTIAALATAAGFFAFVPTDYTGVSELGLIAGVGMVIALLLTLTLLPALLALFRLPGERRPVGFAQAAPVDRFMRRWRGLIIVVAAAVTLVSAFLTFRLPFDFNPLNLQNPDEEAVATLFDLMASPSTTPYTAEVLRPSIPEAAKLASELEKLPEVAQAVSIASYVPDDQKEKLAIIEDTRQLLGPTLSPVTVKPAPDDNETLDALRRAAAELKLASGNGSVAAGRIAQAFDTAVARGPAVLPALQANIEAGIARRLEILRLSLDPEEVTLDTLPPELKSEWVAADGRARVSIFPKGDARDNAVLRHFVDAIRPLAPDATGTPITMLESAATVIHGFMTAGALALLAIAALLVIVLRRVRDVLLVLAPAVFAGLLTLATAVLVGVPLNFANIIALPLLLGIGVAFDIYFVMRWRTGDDNLLQSSTARAILFSALTTGTAFGSLAVSSHPGTADMGKLLTLALFYTVLCTFFILPALLGPAPRTDRANGIKNPADALVGKP
jgi:hopanoid biosynthesis associated RND transporter like protein HpnN